MTISVTNSFRTRDKLNVGAQAFDIQRLEILEQQGVGTIAKLPFSLRILLENLLRCEDGRFVHATTHEQPVVHESTLIDPHWTAAWVGGRRFPLPQ